MEMELNEALEKLSNAGLIAERYGWKGAPTTRYGNPTGHAAYTYRKPTKDRKYIKILQCLLDGEKTKAEVHAALGLPDPTVKDERETQITTIHLYGRNYAMPAL
jgi:hypothetical protein